MARRRWTGCSRLGFCVLGDAKLPGQHLRKGSPVLRFAAGRHRRNCRTARLEMLRGLRCWVARDKPQNPMASLGFGLEGLFGGELWDSVGRHWDRTRAHTHKVPRRCSNQEEFPPQAVREKNFEKPRNSPLSAPPGRERYSSLQEERREEREEKGGRGIGVE